MYIFVNLEKEKCSYLVWEDTLNHYFWINDPEAINQTVLGVQSSLTGMIDWNDNHSDISNSDIFTERAGQFFWNRNAVVRMCVRTSVIRFETQFWQI